MSILSIQSHVAYGHVGNSAAVFALQRLGIEVWPVMTVQLSNHTGYPSWLGRAFEANHIAEVVAGLDEMACWRAARRFCPDIWEAPQSGARCSTPSRVCGAQTPGPSTSAIR